MAAGRVPFRKNAGRRCAAKHYHLQCCHQSLRKRRAVAAGIGALRTFSVSVFAQALHRFTICTVDVCSETLSLTILPSVLVRKASIGSRPWGSSKECEVSMCSETLSLTVLPSELARKAGSSSRPWSSSQECRVKVCGDILSLAVLPSMLARKVESGSRRWIFRKNAGRSCAAKILSLSTGM